MTQPAPVAPAPAALPVPPLVTSPSAAPAATGPVGVNPYDTLKHESMANVLRYGALSALLGGGLRGATGLAHFIRRQTEDPPTGLKRRSSLTIPMPKRAASPPAPAAATVKPPVTPPPAAGKPAPTTANADPYYALAQQLTDATGITVPGGTPYNRPASVAFPAGDQSTYSNDLPWYAPAVAGATLLGGFGAYGLTDAVLDRTRRAEKDSEVESAKARYMAALQGSAKQAGAAEIADPLGEAFNYMTKQGLLGQLAGLYATGLLGTGLAGGALMYNYTRQQAKDKILNKATRLRQQQLLQRGSLPLSVQITTPAESRHA